MEEDKYNWLFDEVKGLKERIRFKDRIEYRRSGEKHNLSGPAIVWDKEDGTDEFWINGKEYTKEDWETMVRPVKLTKLMKKIKDKK